MEFEHSFTVAAGPDATWQLLLDVERSGACLPGAAIEAVDGDRVTGSVRVKLGPLNLTYEGTVRFVETDEAARRIVLDAEGHDARTDSTATMRAIVVLSGSDAATNVDVHTELDVTGKPAQFSRKVLDDVGAKIVALFAESLGHVLDGTAVPAKKSARKAAAKKTTAKKTTAKKTTKTTAKKAAAKKSAAEKSARKAAAKSASTAAAKKTAAKKTAAARTGAAPAPAKSTSSPVPTAAETSAAASAGGTAPSFAAPGGIPPAPTLDDRPSVNGHTGGGPGHSPAQHTTPTGRPRPAAVPVLLKRAAPVVGPAAVGLVIVLAVRHRRTTRHRR